MATAKEMTVDSDLVTLNERFIRLKVGTHRRNDIKFIQRFEQRFKLLSRV